MDIKDALRAIRKHWVIVLIAVLVGVGASAALIITTKPNYRSYVTFFVSTPTTDDASALAADQFVTRRVNSYVRLANSDRLAAMVRDAANLPISPVDLSKELSASADLNTVVLTVDVLDPVQQRSLTIAKAVATQLPQLINTVDRSGNGVQRVRLTVVSGPQLSPYPVRPSRLLVGGLGFLVGLLVGCAIAVLREVLDTSVRSQDALRDLTGHPLLGSIGYDTAAGTEPLLVGRQIRSIRAESFRQLRTNLQFVNVDAPAQTVLVTSSVAGEGKSTTCANLAIVFAETGRSTLLIEADMRRPKVTDYLGLERSVGLSNVLAGQVDVHDVLQTWGDGGLSVLAGGSVPPNPSEILGSKALSDLMADLRSRFDVIIIDTPPLLPVTDAAVMSVHADAVVLVVRFGHTTRAQLAASVRSLEAVDAPLVGSVMNMTRGKAGSAYDGYGYYEDGEGPPPADEPVRVVPPPVNTVQPHVGDARADGNRDGSAAQEPLAQREPVAVGARGAVVGSAKSFARARKNLNRRRD